MSTGTDAGDSDAENPRSQSNNEHGETITVSDLRELAREWIAAECYGDDVRERETGYGDPSFGVTAGRTTSSIILPCIRDAEPGDEIPLDATVVYSPGNAPRSEKTVQTLIDDLEEDGDPNQHPEPEPEPEQTPELRLAELWSEYYPQIEDADAGQGTQLALEMVRGMTRVQADVAVNDGNEADIGMMVEGYINQIADSKTFLARTPLKSVWEDELKKEKAKVSVDDDDLPLEFSKFVRKTLTSVTKTITRDHDASEAEYSLKFADGRGTSFSVPRSTLFSEKLFYEAYTAESGKYPMREGLENNEWSNKISPVIEDLEETRYEDGPRTAAFHSLENLVSTATAYSSIEDAVDHGGVYIDDEPPMQTEVWVLREDVASIIQTHDITDRKLQIEVAARDAHAAAARNTGGENGSGGGDSVSYSTHVHGLWQTFWCLNADAFDDPEEYVDDPEDPDSRVNGAIDNATGETGSDDDDGDGSDDGEHTGEDGENSGETSGEDANTGQSGRVDGDPDPDWGQVFPDDEDDGDDDEDSAEPGMIGRFGGEPDDSDSEENGDDTDDDE